MTIIIMVSILDGLDHQHQGMISMITKGCDESGRKQFICSINDCSLEEEGPENLMSFNKKCSVLSLSLGPWLQILTQAWQHPCALEQIAMQECKDSSTQNSDNPSLQHSLKPPFKLKLNPKCKEASCHNYVPYEDQGACIQPSCPGVYFTTSKMVHLVGFAHEATIWITHMLIWWHLPIM